MIQLRDYQSREMLQPVRQAYAEGARAPLLVAPTGSGKTAYFSYAAHSAASRGKRVVILVHRRELLMQSSRTLESFEVHHGLIAPGQPWRAAGVQVASVQTLVRRLERLDALGWAPDLVIVDEAHHATPTSAWGRVLAHWPQARILGVTATPERLDGQGLGVAVGGYFDRLVVGPSVRALIRDGWLSPPVVWAPSVADLDGVKTRGGDWDRRGAEARVDVPTVTGDAVAHYRRHAEGVPALAFCCSVAHAEHVADTFRAAGYRSASIDGTLGDSERRARIADLANGQLDVLTSCEIVSEGTDIPVVGAAILLRPTQSLGLYLQQVGRVLRPYPGKERAVILDHVGNVFRHGMPDEDRDWDLNIEPRRKRKRRQGEDRAPRRLACPKCAALILPQPVCPNCGFAFPEQRVIAFADGELEQVDPAAVRAQAKILRRRARSLADLEQIERAAGYKPGWAWHVWQARQEKQQQRRAA